MPGTTKSKEDDARAWRCFVEQFPDLDGTSAWNIFRDISALIFDLLVVETIRYANQKNARLFIDISSETQKFLGVITLSANNSRRKLRGYLLSFAFIGFPPGNI